MSFTDKVRRKLENDEPKCANCKWWGSPLSDSDAGKIVRECTYADRGFFHYTSDLCLCSAWEQK